MPDPIHPPKINVGPAGPAAWLQAGYKYGVNDSGPFQSFSYRGTRAEVAALGPQFNVEGWTWAVTHEAAGLATLEAQAGFGGGPGYVDEEPENIWELDPNEVEKPLLEADFPFGSIGTITPENKAIIADALKRPDEFATSSPAFTGANIGGANSLYLLLRAEVQSFPVEASVIRHTQVVSNRYTVKTSYNNCNRIISTAAMTSVEGVPSDLLYNLPSEPSPTQYIETPASPGIANDLQYGWRKIRPAVTRMSRFKWRITQNYQFGLWAIKLYGNRIGN